MKLTKQSSGVGRYLKRDANARRSVPFPTYERDSTPDLVDILNGAVPCQERQRGSKAIKCQRCGHVNRVDDMYSDEVEVICESCGLGTMDDERIGW